MAAKGAKTMDFMSAREAASRWGISQRRVALLCAEGRIENATIIGNMWIIPATAQKPLDARSTRRAKSEEAGLRPFIKWAGGKTQLLSELSLLYPFKNGKIRKYAEPFVGGGAVLFDILSKFDVDEVYISDSNPDLMNAYRILRDETEELLDMLRVMQEEYLPLDEAARRTYYAEKRDAFNALRVGKDEGINIAKAGLFIFLNKTCFNGLYRVNKKGAFNVPIGAYKAPVICDEDNLRAVAHALQRVKIVCADYKAAADFIDAQTFVYIDPPYRPLTQTSRFTAYTEGAFNDEDQTELAAFFAEMSQKGALLVASNADPTNADPADDFFDRLYGDYTIARVLASRAINSKGEGRGKVRELLIRNF